MRRIYDPVVPRILASRLAFLLLLIASSLPLPVFGRLTSFRVSLFFFLLRTSVSYNLPVFLVCEGSVVRI